MSNQASTLTERNQAFFESVLPYNALSLPLVDNPVLFIQKVTSVLEAIYRHHVSQTPQLLVPFPRYTLAARVVEKSEGRGFLVAVG